MSERARRFSRIVSSSSIVIFLTYGLYIVGTWTRLFGFGALSATDWLVISFLLACCVASAIAIKSGQEGLVQLVPVTIFFIGYSAIEMVEYFETRGGIEPEIFSPVHGAPVVASLIIAVLALVRWRVADS